METHMDCPFAGLPARSILNPGTLQPWADRENARAGFSKLNFRWTIFDKRFGDDLRRCESQDNEVPGRFEFAGNRPCESFGMTGNRMIGLSSNLGARGGWHNRTMRGALHNEANRLLLGQRDATATGNNTSTLDFTHGRSTAQMSRRDHRRRSLHLGGHESGIGAGSWE
jgi:hypothetical protein